MSEGRRRRMSSSSREGEFALPLPFCSIQALRGLDYAHLHWGGPSSLLSSPIQISSRNTLAPRNNVLPAVSGHPLAQ